MSSSTCPDCDGGTVRRTNGEQFCTDCGLVVEQRHLAQDQRPRAAVDDTTGHSTTQWGAPSTEQLHDRGRGSRFDPSDSRPGSSRTGGQDGGVDYERLAERQTWCERDGSDRSLTYLLGEVRRLGSALDLPDSVAERAARIARQAYSLGMVGRDLDTYAPAAVLIAARQSEVVRWPQDLADAARTDLTTIRRRVMKLSNDLELAVPIRPVTEWVQTVSEEVPPKAGGRDGRIRQTALDLARTVEDNRTAFGGAPPRQIALACLWFSQAVEQGPDRETQADFADRAGVRVETLRGHISTLDDVADVSFEHYHAAMP